MVRECLKIRVRRRWWSLGILSASSIQNIQNPLALVARATNGNREHQAHHLPRPHHVEFPPRTEHLRREHNKASDLLERLNEGDVLTRRQALGKSARRSVGFPSAKQETTSHPPDEAGGQDCEEKYDASPQGSRAVEIKDAPATGSTRTQGCQRRTDCSLIDLRIRIHEEKHLAARGACAGITHSGDLAMLDSNRASAHLLCNPGSCIRRCVIHHDHFVGLGECCHRRADAAEALTNPKLLIMGGDNEGDHSLASILQRTGFMLVDLIIDNSGE